MKPLHRVLVVESARQRRCWSLRRFQVRPDVRCQGDISSQFNQQKPVSVTCALGVRGNSSTTRDERADRENIGAESFSDTSTQGVSGVEGTIP